jgi:hypothetical protein
MRAFPAALCCGRSDREDAYAVTLHEWRPDGGAYPGLPQDLDEAAGRRRGRITVETADPGLPDFDREAPPEALTPWHLDLRRL